MGALRFKDKFDGSFLNDNKDFSPPWTSIRELEQISLRLEDDDAIEYSEYLKWLLVCTFEFRFSYLHIDLLIWKLSQTLIFS